MFEPNEFRIFVVLLCICSLVPNVSLANEVTWKSFVSKPEKITTKNLVPDSALPELCKNSSLKSSTSGGTPPIISTIGRIDLDNYVTGVAWSDNGLYVATSENYDRIVKIWSFPALKLLHMIDKGQAGSLNRTNLLFSKDNKLLITSSAVPYTENSGNALSVIDVASGKIIINVQGNDVPPRYPFADEPSDLRLSDDGRYLFLEFNGDVWDEYVIDTTTWRIVNKISSAELTMDTGPEADQVSLTHMVTLPNGNPQAPEDHQQRIEVWDQILQKFVFDANFLTESMFPITTMGINTETCTFVFGSFRSSANNGLAVWYPAFSQVYILPSETPVTDLSISRTADIVATIDNYSHVNLFYLGG